MRLSATSFCFFFFLMLRRPPRSTRTHNTLSLHDALPISCPASSCRSPPSPPHKPLRGNMTPPHRRKYWRSSHSWRRPSTALHNSRSEEHTSELQSLMRISYAVFCLKKKTKTSQHIHNTQVCIKQIRYTNDTNTT